MMPIKLFPHNLNKAKEDKTLSKLNSKISELFWSKALDKKTDVTIDHSDLITLQSAIEIYARWLEAQEIMSGYGNGIRQDEKLRQVARLLELIDDNKKRKYEPYSLINRYLSKTEWADKTSNEDRISAIKEIQKEFSFPSHDACLKALQRACIGRDIKIPTNWDI